MANSVRKIYTKIGNGHQYLLGTAKTSAYGGHVVSDTVQQHSARPQVETTLCKINAENLFRQSRPLLNYIVRPVKNKRSADVAVEWFNIHTNPKNNVCNSTELKPDNSTKSNENIGTSDSNGLPNLEQLDHVYNRLGEDLPLMFKQNLDYALYHPKLVFENNIRGTKSVGLEYFMTTISLLRLMGHIKYAFVKFDILKITKHPEDGTIKVRWRIKGISGLKVFMKFWKFRLWNLEQVIKENVESWHDGFSVFYLGSDGQVHKLTADKMQPDNDPVIEDKNPLATKLALFLGLSPQLGNLDCLISFDSEPANELLKMVIMSLEDVI
ncbi:uncharacterized protein C6orf136 homolog [Acyrthosiphon pisum]|uniref:Uncharacterized protein n=1 Tax=Acyrthosiphon pisum TaxID=7029 RepID=A0A8R2NMM5_ACYPI|nr:uncharacterized protein C6orf136 homolog [Acyrthosiphon pisum]|eukprot:XP_016659303.1 PREDICTED: uncharacterized protein C6orf136 homolog [Acyrthosiphon pisum]